MKYELGCIILLRLSALNSIQHGARFLYVGNMGNIVQTLPLLTLFACSVLP